VRLLAAIKNKFLPKKEKLKLLPHYSIVFPPDSLEELHAQLIEKMTEFDSGCFDFDVPNQRLDAMKRIIVGHGMEWSDPDEFEYHGMTTIVVGWPGADFAEHERLR
jgi:hypothetical protein